ncbi:hypothetical protein M422DRAFT_270233 [Sphaerobolus stellatus SS14]|uniref:Unplaced genomic scaffold SPHSTscaffold_230, whole genome shotgun sequence n=1 Tax=Sphaerobolus stellatus (strain SS14) TaxID=990650 RepID=A0A0C9U2T8_SPHS4|nr:hypothetical protein M422DRAFT_270233 [Sphaerobolus stellatus SS14]
MPSTRRGKAATANTPAIPETNSQIDQVKEEIARVRRKALAALTSRARAAKQRIPRQLPAKWDSVEHRMLRERLQQLEAQSSQVDSGGVSEVEGSGAEATVDSVITGSTACALPAIVTQPKPVSKCQPHLIIEGTSVLPPPTSSVAPAVSTPSPLLLGSDAVPAQTPTPSSAESASFLPPTSAVAHAPSPVDTITTADWAVPLAAPASTSVPPVKDFAASVAMAEDVPSFTPPHTVFVDSPPAQAESPPGPLVRMKTNTKAEAAVRPGTLTKGQLGILRDQQAIWDTWILDTARAWKVNPITITTNMGVDHREQRTTSFWNKFQAVFWNGIGDADWDEIKREEGVKKKLKGKGKGKGKEKEELKEQDGGSVVAVNNMAEEEESLIPKGKLAILKDRCSDEYVCFDRLTKGSELSESEQETLLTEKKEGDTHKLIRQARKEFTTRAMYYWTRGLAIFGAIASCDPVDATASTLNILFAGSDTARKYLDSQRGNLRLYRAHKDYNQGRCTEIANLLKGMWAKAMDVEIPYAVPWDRWPSDMETLQCCLEGWPDDVPWPGGPKSYKALESSKVTAALWPYICNQKTFVLTVLLEYFQLAKQLSSHCLDNNDAYQSICLIRGASGQPLLTIGQIAEQAVARNKDKLAIKRREVKKVEHVEEDVAQPKASKRKAKQTKPKETNTKSEGEGSSKKRKLFNSPVLRQVDIHKVIEEEKSAKAKKGAKATVNSKPYISIDDENSNESAVQTSQPVSLASLQAVAALADSSTQARPSMSGATMVNQHKFSPMPLPTDTGMLNLGAFPNIQQMIQNAIQAQFQQMLQAQNGLPLALPGGSNLGQHTSTQVAHANQATPSMPFSHPNDGAQGTNGANRRIGSMPPAMMTDFGYATDNQFGTGFDFLGQMPSQQNGWGNP